MKQESKQDIILRLTEGLNAQQRSVPQLPAQARARKIKVLGAKTDPKHPFAGYMVGADESAESGKKNIGPDKNDPYEKGWRAGFRHNESNPYPAGSKQAAQWDRGYAEAEAQPNHYDESLAEVDFNPGRRGFLKKAGAVAATAAMPTGLAGAAAKAIAPAASWASTLSAPLAGLTAIDLDDIINLLMTSNQDDDVHGPYDLDTIKKIAVDAARESWGNAWFMNGNAAKALLDTIELGKKKGMDGEDIIQDLFIVTKKQYMQELKKLSPEEVAKVKSQSLNPDNKSEPAASPTTGMSGLARAAGAQIGRTMKNVGKATATTVLNQPAKSAALPAPTVSPGMQIPKQKSRVSAEQDKELGEASGIYNPDGKTFRGSKNPMPTYDPNDAMMQGDYDQLDTVSATDTGGIDNVENNIDRNRLKDLIRASMKSLTPDEKEVLNLRYWHDQTLHQVANSLGLTHERIRQIEAKALRKLRNPEGPDQLQKYINPNFKPKPAPMAIGNVVKSLSTANGPKVGSYYEMGFKDAINGTNSMTRHNAMSSDETWDQRSQYDAGYESGKRKIKSSKVRESLSPFNDDHSELDQFVKEEFNRDPDDLDEYADLEEGWKSKLAGAALAGAAAFGGGGAQANDQIAKDTQAITQAIQSGQMKSQEFAAGEIRPSQIYSHPKWLETVQAMNKKYPGNSEQARQAAITAIKQMIQQGNVREGAGTVGGNNPAAAWPEFGTAKTYESQLAEAKQRLAEAESRYVLYFNGKPASHYATEAEAKRIADSIKAKHPTVKIEIKNEMHEGDLNEVTGDLPFDTMLSKIVAGGNLQTLAAKIVAKIKKFPQYRMPGDDERDEFDWPNGYPDGHFFGDDLWIDDSFNSIIGKWKSLGPDKFADENEELSFKPSMESSNDYTSYWNGVLEVLRRLESIPGATEQLAKMVWHGLFSGNVEQGITDIGKPGVAEGKSGIDKYVKLLKNHDWTYDYGDDQEAQRGYDERQVLLRLAKNLDPKFKIWNEYAPADIYKKNLSKPKDNYDRNDPDNWYDESVAEGYKFKGGFPFDVDHMSGAVHKQDLDTKKKFTDEELWLNTVNKLNSSLYDDNSDYISSGNGYRVEIMGKVWAKWDGVKDAGWIETSPLAEGARVDRMVKHIASSEKATGKSNKDAENIAWATVNKRGYLDNKNKKKHVAEAGTPADIRAKNRAVVKKIQGKEVKEDITQEDIITKLKAKLGDYLSDLGQQIKKDPALQDKLSAKPPGDQVGPPVKTLTTDDGHEISIHGNEDDGFRISIKNRQTPSKFDSLDEAVMACEMYRAHRRKQALTADYVEEA